VLIGSNGQLGSDLVSALSSDELTCLTHSDIEITDAAQVGAVLASYRPEVVINTAAFHRVDDCERNPEQAFAANAYGVRNLALACRSQDATLVHMSSDYVFDGRKGLPYTETDTPAPINAYGISKLAGELFIRYVLDRYFIVRTTGLYGIAGSSGKGGNFVELMLRLAGEGKPIRVVDDQVLTPTYTVDLARKIRELIATDRYGLYHVTSGGQCSWFEFAQAIFRLSGMMPPLTPQTTSQSGAFARRPAYSVLDHSMLRRAGFADMRPWPDALEAYLRRRKQPNSA
jgi:dTDP-4-dehydrorhamnose reductase